MRLSILVTVLILSLLTLMGATAYGKDINLAWEPSPTPTVTGYKAHFVCGELSYDEAGALVPFPGIVDVGNVLEATLTGFDDFAECWFAVTAYDGVMEDSVYSNVVFSPGYVRPTPPGQLRGNTKVRGKDFDLE